MRISVAMSTMLMAANAFLWFPHASRTFGSQLSVTGWHTKTPVRMACIIQQKLHTIAKYGIQL